MGRILPSFACLWLPLLLYVWCISIQKVQVNGFAGDRRGLLQGRKNIKRFVMAEPWQVATESDTTIHPRLVFGTSALGKAEDPFALLDAAYEKGFHRFDLARTYGGGISERIFGEWMELRGIDRSSVDIITKGGMGDDKYGDPNRPILTREVLLNEVQASLDALKTDSVDMYMFHRDDPRLDISQFVLWANEIVLDGKTKMWGVSNWSFERFQQAYEFALSNNLEPPRANSPQFSLAVPKCEVWPTTESISGLQDCKKQIEWYEKNNIELLCWEVLAKGFMAKPNLWSQDTVDPRSFDKSTELGTDEWRLQRIQRAYCYDMNYRRRRVALQLAKQYGYTLSQVAVQYILSMGKNIYVIFGSNNLDHLEDMAELCDCDLDEEAKLRLSSISLPSTTPSVPSQHQQIPQIVLETATVTGGRNIRRSNETAVAP